MSQNLHKLLKVVNCNTSYMFLQKVSEKKVILEPKEQVLLIYFKNGIVIMGTEYSKF